MSTIKNDWDKAAEFHGHTCPGLATGFRVAKIAMKELETIRSADEEIVAIVENDACGIDAIQVITGCTIGKGNLIYRDLGKQVYTFACRNSGRAVRIAVRNKTWQGDPQMKEIKKKYFSGTASEEERKIFQEHQNERIKHILELPAVEFCEVKHIAIDLPSRARIFESYLCAECGESVMEPRARLKNGKIVCIPCSDNYSRGW